MPVFPLKDPRRALVAIAAGRLREITPVVLPTSPAPESESECSWGSLGLDHHAEKATTLCGLRTYLCHGQEDLVEVHDQISQFGL